MPFHEQLGDAAKRGPALLLFLPLCLGMDLTRIVPTLGLFDDLPCVVSSFGKGDGRVSAEGDASEFAVHSGRDEPSLGAGVRDPQSEGGQVRVEILNLTGLGRPEALDSSGSKARLRHDPR